MIMPEPTSAKRQCAVAETAIKKESEKKIKGQIKRGKMVFLYQSFINSPTEALVSCH